MPCLRLGRQGGEPRLPRGASKAGRLASALMGLQGTKVQHPQLASLRGRRWPRLRRLLLLLLLQPPSLPLHQHVMCMLCATKH